MTTAVSPGVTTGGKTINLAQLQTELATAGVVVSGLGMDNDLIYPYDGDGVPTDFASADQVTVEQAIADHVALRDKADEEYSIEFQNPATTVARKQEIRDILNGLLPREQVPM